MHTFATLFATCSAYNNKLDGRNLLRAKYELRLAHSDTVALQVAEGMLHASNLSRNVAKSTSLATCNATMAVAKWGVTHEFFLTTCNATLQVARKTASCNMALSYVVRRLLIEY